MNSMKHLFVNSTERLSSLLKRIKQETSKKITLVIPKGAVILKSLDNLKKIKKKAKILRKTIKFISNDQRMAKKRKTKKIAKKRFSRQHYLSSLTAKSFIVFALAVLILTNATLYLILPRANIVIEPKTEPLIMDLEIIADQYIQAPDLQTNKVPGELKSFEDQIIRRFPAASKRYLEAKAHGIITVYNNSKAQVWREETRFEDPNGLIFKTLKFEKIPYGTRDVEVEAENPGQEYNIAPSTFTIPAFRERKDPQYGLITGKSEKSMTGGIKQEITFVSRQDIIQAKETLKQELREKLQEKFASEIFQEKVLIDESSVSPGTEAKAFNVNLKMSFNSLIFDEQDLLNLVRENFLARITGNKGLYGEPKITYGQPELVLEQGQMIVPLHIEQQAVWKIESDKLKDQLAGKNPEEAKYLLERQAGINLVKVNLWPFWVKKIPSSESKIKIKID